MNDESSIDLQALFGQFTHLEERYLPGAPEEHDILFILERALLVGEMMLAKGITESDDHRQLIRNALRIAYGAGIREARSGESDE